MRCIDVSIVDELLLLKSSPANHCRWRCSLSLIITITTIIIIIVDVVVVDDDVVVVVVVVVVVILILFLCPEVYRITEGIDTI